MTRFLGYVVAGLANGTIYALVALGVVVVYRISRVVNLAHGAMGVFATYCFFYVFIGDWGLPVALAFVLTLFVGGFVAADDVPQAAGSYAVGMYGFTSFDFYKSNTPGIQQYRAITENYYPNTFHHFYEQAAYIGAEAIVAAMRKAGPKLTRPAFINALKSFTDFDTGMGLHVNFANIGSSQLSSGLMLKADNSLKWQVLTGRFKSAA